MVTLKKIPGIKIELLHDHFPLYEKDFNQPLTVISCLGENSVQM